MKRSVSIILISIFMISLIPFLSESYDYKIVNPPPDIVGLQVTLHAENNSAILNWWAYDEDPDNYEIYVNDELNKTGIWMNDVLITLKLENLAFGTYNITLVAYDLVGSYDVDWFEFSFEIQTHTTSYPILVIPLIYLTLASFISIRRKKKKH